MIPEADEIEMDGGWLGAERRRKSGGAYCTIDLEHSTERTTAQIKSETCNQAVAFLGLQLHSQGDVHSPSHAASIRPGPNLHLQMPS